ncbi:hypothetical protein LEP1GSC081_4027 [Leptospira kirschneri str. H1]|uniref:Uncharacterized protein n=1 Tax=Leptospira kirschneri str. H1 TaxID=1049966 RepID=A0A0E2BA16_9LEPT|nr:hypothetical protein LEP1GSC081_4027 [Leptospira kirschneri str. H1]
MDLTDILRNRRLLYTTKNKLERENTFVRWFEKETVNFNSA